MTLAILTAIMSKVMKQHPELHGDRNVAIFVQACIEEGRRYLDRNIQPPRR